MFETLDITFSDILADDDAAAYNVSFGGKVFVLGAICDRSYLL